MTAPPVVSDRTVLEPGSEVRLHPRVVAGSRPRSGARRARAAGLEVEVERSPAVCVVRLRGDLDLASETPARDLLTEQLAHGPAVLVVDLRRAFVDVRGLAVLVDATRDARERGCRVVVVHPPSSLLLMLRALPWPAGEVPLSLVPRPGRRVLPVNSRWPR